MNFFGDTEIQTPISGWNKKKQLLWSKLKNHAEHIKKCSVLSLFEKLPDRSSHFSIDAGPLHIDYSRQLIDEHALNLLLELAEESGIDAKFEALFSGGNVNISEKRAALHHTLRSFLFNEETLNKKVIEHTWLKLLQFTQGIHKETILGATGKKISHIVNIGIGGSDLGPKLLVEALKPYHLPHCKIHFISNIDASEIHLLLPCLRADETLFIVSSKSFSTMETLKNAEIALNWIKINLGESATKKHFVAVTANISKAMSLGIAEDSIFPVWDWVGGRYSVWSAMGLSVLLAIGEIHFTHFLRGGFILDERVKNKSDLQNPAIILALIDIWNTNFLGAQSQAIIPYASSLRSFPDYLQQLMMESNGKRVSQEGHLVSYMTCPVIWGNVGTNSQHSFHQLIHQGTPFFSVDFILPLKNDFDGNLQKHLVASCLGQSQAMLIGRHEENVRQSLDYGQLTEESYNQLVRQQVVPGNRPHTLIVIPQVDPEALGSLIALYEHRVFTQSVIWDINPFDQWGVELGKKLSTDILSKMSGIFEEKKIKASQSPEILPTEIIRRFRVANEKK